MIFPAYIFFGLNLFKIFNLFFAFLQSNIGFFPIGPFTDRSADALHFAPSVHRPDRSHLDLKKRFHGFSDLDFIGVSGHHETEEIVFLLQLRGLFRQNGFYDRFVLIAHRLRTSPKDLAALDERISWSYFNKSKTFNVPHGTIFAFGLFRTDNSRFRLSC